MTFVYLLDTCTVSDFAKAQPGVIARIKSTAPTLVSISSITVMEIECGLQFNPKRAEKVAPVLAAFVDSVQILPLSLEDARAAGAIRAGLTKQGRPIGAYDVLLAGCAVCRGLIFVTSNTTEFERVGGLRLENWRS
ncbi:type II toxin-antitoxin system VapC family toxin [Gloeobacter violaceus]|uniref:Gll0844 protein n=1 Tax=Gloeobacter violaceus (strain ATCC 29082 / PCC 7421) TaxID=251221 RepID=Q7NMC2_GLOVI|nr:type II toxin-antitoxin system VapC family toxin [Gloeobacter violaceus]BAC88785.1 gll0844 [Gloeobacter violaceus PCC 7421]